MTSADLDKQLIVTVNNRVGSLAEVAGVVSSSGINLVAVCAYGVDSKGVIMFVAEDSAGAKKLLKAKGYDVREEEVILVTLDNKPGTLKIVTEKISHLNIDINLLYASTGSKAKTSRVVIVTENNKTALAALKL